jgi:hypothetical protein
MVRMTPMFFVNKSAKSASSAFGFWVCTVEEKRLAILAGQVFLIITSSLLARCLFGFPEQVADHVSGRGNCLFVFQKYVNLLTDRGGQILS